MMQVAALPTFSTARSLRLPSTRSDCQTMVPAKTQGDVQRSKALAYPFVKAPADFTDFLCISRPAVFDADDFRDWDRDVAAVGCRAAEIADAAADIGDSKGRWPHVYAPAPGAKI